MGKSYIENSLKRFLKRKVKITLGVVVSFLITGMVAFAVDKPVEEMNDFEKAEHYLAGLGKKENNLEIETGKEYKNPNGSQKITVSNDNGNIKLKFEGFVTAGAGNPEFTIKNEYVSNITKPIIEKSFNNAVTALKKGEITSSVKENNGFINIGGGYGITNGINNGLIMAQHGMSEDSINNGIIIFGETNYGMTGSNLVNNGLIFSKGTTWQSTGQTTSKLAVNNGIIKSGRGQVTGAAESKLFNYGILDTTSSGQGLEGVKKSHSYNYGIIVVGGLYGQVINNINANSIAEKSTMNNYGIIKANNSTAQAIREHYGFTKGNVANNYGVIKIGTKGTAISVANDKNIADESLKNKGFNYGTVIVNTENTTIDQKNPVKVFEGDVINKGIVILDKYTGTDLTNITLGDNSAEDKGLIFKKGDDGYSLLNSNKVAQYTGGNKNITNTFTDSKTTTAYVTGTNNKITENLSDKVIGTIVKEDISEKGAVITAGDDITLENTVITGYFENDGTLLDMGSNNLTLLGDTKLVASKDNFSLTGVNALNIDGVLKMIGNAEIAGKITGKGKIQEVAVNGENGKHNSAFELSEVLLQNATEQEEKYLETVDDNYTEVSYSDLTTNQIILDFDRTAKDKENTITFTDNLLIKGKDGIAIDGRGTTETGNNINLNFSSLDSNKVQGDILLGASNDDIVVEKNGKYDSTIDMGAGNDSFTVNGFAQSTTKADNHKELGTFNYKLAGVETITLKGNGINKNNGWHIGEQASLSGTNGTTLKIENTELHVDMNNNYGKGKVTTSLDKMAGGVDLSVTTGKDAEVKFTVGDKFNVSEKQFDVAHNYDVAKANLGAAVIFKGTGEDGAVEEKDGKISLTVKDASEVGLSGYEGIYNAVLKGLSEDGILRSAVNYQNESELVEMIKGAGETAEAFYTTGYAVTKDVTDTYMSVVDDFGRKAGAGEWIAYGKYVNSDTEFDGGKASKGYDGDITGTVGMIEYGVNDTTSYGAVFGKGDTKVDINGGGKLDGDNTYFGGYIKHRTQGGIDLIGNIGITKSELDLNLATNIINGGANHQIITNGNSDADALTFALKGTKDYKLSDSMRLQPVVSAKYSFITQDEITSSDANFKMDEQDVTIFEGSIGGNVVKDFDIYNGRLSLSVGAEYILTDVNKDDNARYHLYNEKLYFAGEEDIADNKIRTHVGAEYIHENGVGIDTKYEMIFTDKGDTDRITAGISYRF